MQVASPPPLQSLPTLLSDSLPQPRPPLELCQERGFPTTWNRATHNFYLRKEGTTGYALDPVLVLGRHSVAIWGQYLQS